LKLNSCRGRCPWLCSWFILFLRVIQNCFKELKQYRTPDTAKTKTRPPGRRKTWGLRCRIGEKKEIQSAPGGLIPLRPKAGKIKKNKKECRIRQHKKVEKFLRASRKKFDRTSEAERKAERSGKAKADKQRGEAEDKLKGGRQQAATAKAVV